MPRFRGLREVRGPVELVIIKDGSHLPRLPLAPFGADWMTEQLPAAA
jgi:hypothetical protein